MNIREIISKFQNKKYTLSEQSMKQITENYSITRYGAELFGKEGLRLDNIKEYPTKYEEILSCLLTDKRLCSIVVSLREGTSAIGQHSQLSHDQIDTICAISLFSLMPTMLKKKIFMLGDAFLHQFNLQWGSQDEQVIGVKVIEKSTQVLMKNASKMEVRLKYVRSPQEFPFLVALYDNSDEAGEQRYVIIHEKADASRIAKGILAGVHGFNYDQVDYFISSKNSIYDPQICLNRTDIWERILQSSVCHATEKWPELRAWGWK